MRKYICLFALALLAAFPGCQDLGSNANIQYLAGVHVQAKDTSMVITNSTADTIRYFIVERGTAALINWAPACGNSNGVPKRSEVELSYSNVYGYYPGCEIIVNWWHCTKEVTGRIRPGAIQSIVTGTP